MNKILEDFINVIMKEKTYASVEEIREVVI